MVIVSGCVVVLLGAFKNYYAYEYFMKGKEVLNEDIRDIRDSSFTVMQVSCRRSPTNRASRTASTDP